MAAPAVGLTAAPGQHVLRILAHDGPARDAIGAIEEVRGRWAGRRAGVRITQTKVAVGRMPGQAGSGVAAVWDVSQPLLPGVTKTAGAQTISKTKSNKQEV
eukprot:15060642-Alexandrium_andersonii.AAC.1